MHWPTDPRGGGLGKSVELVDGIIDLTYSSVNHKLSGRVRIHHSFVELTSY